MSALLQSRRLIMRMPMLVATGILFSVIAGCANINTEYKPFEANVNVFEGRGGTKVVIDGLEYWDNGDPPRKFKILGIIDDERPGGRIQMSNLRRDIIQKAKEAGGDAVVQVTNNSLNVGSVASGVASASAYGGTATGFGTSIAVPVKRNVSKFAVIKYLE